MKKAQTEIIGLLVIVVMISVIMLFAYKSLFDTDDGVLQSYKKEDLASSTIRSVLGTHSGCREFTEFQKLIIDCVKYGSTGSFTCDDTSSTCEYAQREISNMLDKTLGAWKYEYHFMVIGPGGAPVPELEIRSDKLESGGDVAADDQPLNIDTRGTQIRILLCIGGECLT